MNVPISDTKSFHQQMSYNEQQNYPMQYNPQISNQSQMHAGVQMSNTKYEMTSNEKGTKLINVRQKDLDTYSVNSKVSTNSKYKKYNLKDYKHMKTNI